MKNIVIAAIVLISNAYAFNYYGRHGDNYFSYNGIRSFPIVWDVRGARSALSTYRYDYGGTTSDGFIPFADLMSDAKDAGINTVLIRDMSDPYAAVPGSTFEQMATIARNEGLDVIGGGFKTSLNQSSYNNAVVAFLDNYQNYQSSGTGDFVGVMLFDEPDARYESGETKLEVNDDWVDLVSFYATHVERTLGLPVTCFLDRYTSSTTVDLFCSLLDFPVYDRYPCNIYDYEPYTIQSTLREFVSTDLEAESFDAYTVYATQDELIRIYNTSVHIYRYIDETTPEGLQTQDFMSISVPPGASQLCYAASDFRTMDVGNRSTGEHDLNGAIVTWREGTTDNKVIYNHDGSIDSTVMPMPLSAISILGVSVGQTNYPIEHPTRDSRTGMIGQGELRILMIYQTANSICVRIFRKSDGSSPGLTNVFTGTQHSIQLPSGFSPDGAVWGSFWNREEPTQDGYERIVDPASGFVLYDTSTRQYCVIYQNASQADGETWACSVVRPNLFPSSIGIINEELMFVSRCNLGRGGTENLPPYVAGRDYLCYVEDGSSGDWLRWTVGDEPQNGLLYNDVVNIQTLPWSITSATADRCGHTWNTRADRLILGYDQEYFDRVYKSSTPLTFETQDPITLDYVTMGSDVLCMASSRVYETKLPFRSSVVSRGGDVYLTDAQLHNTPGDPMYTSNYINEKESVWNWGIEGNTGKSFFPNVQAYGRHGQENATYYPTLDQLRYMVVSPIIRGARGVQFYALDLAMGSGNGNGGGNNQMSSFITPSLLINWGPSIDTENVNMIARVHQISNELNGWIDGDKMDFASVLCASNTNAMDTTEVVHAEYWAGSINQVEDPQSGFIALEAGDGTMWVLLANDSGNSIPNRVLWFKNELGAAWNLHNVGGYQVTEIGGNEMTRGCLDQSRARIPLMIDYSGMPAYGSSLFYLTESTSGTVPLDLNHAGRASELSVDLHSNLISVSYMVSYSDNANIAVYDIMGRRQVEIPVMSESTLESSVDINVESFASGVYFVVLSNDLDTISEKVVLLNPRQ